TVDSTAVFVQTKEPKPQLQLKVGLIVFWNKLKNQVAEEGKAVTLHCELSRSGAAVEWWKGEKLLQPGQKYQLRERDASHELVITDTVPEDSGVYTCVCEGQKSKATIRIAGTRIRLCVATTFKQNLKNQEAPEGGSVVLRCELSKSSVPVQWWKGEQCLMPGGRYRMRQDSNVAEMEITDVLPDHAGMYSCVTANQKSSQVNCKVYDVGLKKICFTSSSSHFPAGARGSGFQRRRQCCVHL
uniref:Ig-like domain-containing protein n=1 Tax=Electrophorus electricus TaxID=8005 RepID=A0AAY5F4W9_ELEEL